MSKGKGEKGKMYHDKESTGAVSFLRWGMMWDNIHNLIKKLREIKRGRWGQGYTSFIAVDSRFKVASLENGQKEYINSLFKYFNKYTAF